jgi:hypothetical protein
MKYYLLVAAVWAVTVVAGTAIAGSCATYCGTFAGHKWCNTQCH